MFLSINIHLALISSLGNFIDLCSDDAFTKAFWCWCRGHLLIVCPAAGILLECNGVARWCSGSFSLTSPTCCVFFCCRWTRREQADFYRTVSSFGVVFDPERKAFDWSQFRVLARLERKTDESLERYFNSFVNMCRTACKLPPRKEEGNELICNPMGGGAFLTFRLQWLPVSLRLQVYWCFLKPTWNQFLNQAFQSHWMGLWLMPL